MGFFSKSKNKKEIQASSSAPQKMPELPPIPDFPQDNDFRQPALPQFPLKTQLSLTQQSPSQLPSFPNSQIGQKMSQNIIKDAIYDEEKSYSPQFKDSDRLMSPRTEEISSMAFKTSPVPALTLTPSQTQALQKSQVIQLKESDWRNASIEMSDWTSHPQQHDISEYPTHITIKRPETGTVKIKRIEPIYIKLDKFESTMATFHDIKAKVAEVESLLKDIRKTKIQEEKELNDWENELTELKARLDQIDQQVFKEI